MRSGSLIIINGKSAPYFELEENERFKVVEAFFNNTLIAIGGYVLLKHAFAPADSPSF
ncbi:hypothetical protein [Paradesulfitobacterium ferrireducens]|uniref:hypothetical protein n=1 Tax=Paradesulfitobacterium ferrireducens TaxID=2816476 RepID=UPI001A90BEE6|nr:hypothetical protein [Paradesulfitobacterium ferrireducens]